MLVFQIDFLQQKTREMERKLHDANVERDDVLNLNNKVQAKNRDLESRVRDLQFDLKDVDLMAKKIETEKYSLVKTADREMTEAKVGDKIHY